MQEVDFHIGSFAFMSVTPLTMNHNMTVTLLLLGIWHKGGVIAKQTWCVVPLQIMKFGFTSKNSLLVQHQHFVWSFTGSPAYIHMYITWRSHINHGLSSVIIRPIKEPFWFYPTTRHSTYFLAAIEDCITFVRFWSVGMDVLDNDNNGLLCMEIEMLVFDRFCRTMCNYDGEGADGLP